MFSQIKGKTKIKDLTKDLKRQVKDLEEKAFKELSKTISPELIILGFKDFQKTFNPAKIKDFVNYLKIAHRQAIKAQKEKDEHTAFLLTHEAIKNLEWILAKNLKMPRQEELALISYLVDSYFIMSMTISMPLQQDAPLPVTESQKEYLLDQEKNYLEKMLFWNKKLIQVSKKTEDLKLAKEKLSNSYSALSYNAFKYKNYSESMLYMMQVPYPPSGHIANLIVPSLSLSGARYPEIQPFYNLLCSLYDENYSPPANYPKGIEAYPRWTKDWFKFLLDNLADEYEFGLQFHLDYILKEYNRVGFTNKALKKFFSLNETFVKNEMAKRNKPNTLLEKNIRKKVLVSPEEKSKNFITLIMQPLQEANYSNELLTNIASELALIIAKLEPTFNKTIIVLLRKHLKNITENNLRYEKYPLTASAISTEIMKSLDAAKEEKQEGIKSLLVNAILQTALAEQTIDLPKQTLIQPCKDDLKIKMADLHQEVDKRLNVFTRLSMESWLEGTEGADKLEELLAKRVKLFDNEDYVKAHKKYGEKIAFAFYDLQQTLKSFKEFVQIEEKKKYLFERLSAWENSVDSLSQLENTVSSTNAILLKIEEKKLKKITEKEQVETPIKSVRKSPIKQILPPRDRTISQPSPSLAPSSYSTPSSTSEVEEKEVPFRQKPARRLTLKDYLAPVMLRQERLEVQTILPLWKETLQTALQVRASYPKVALYTLLGIAAQMMEELKNQKTSFLLSSEKAAHVRNVIYHDFANLFYENSHFTLYDILHLNLEIISYLGKDSKEDSKITSELFDTLMSHSISKTHQPKLCRRFIKKQEAILAEFKSAVVPENVLHMAIGFVYGVLGVYAKELLANQSSHISLERRHKLKSYQRLGRKFRHNEPLIIDSSDESSSLEEEEHKEITVTQERKQLSIDTTCGQEEPDIDTPIPITINKLNAHAKEFSMPNTELSSQQIPPAVHQQPAAPLLQTMPVQQGPLFPPPLPPSMFFMVPQPMYIAQPVVYYVPQPMAYAPVSIALAPYQPTFFAPVPASNPIPFEQHAVPPAFLPNPNQSFQG